MLRLGLFALRQDSANDRLPREKRSEKHAELVTGELPTRDRTVHFMEEFFHV